MLLSGLVLLTFVLYHLSHFTFFLVHPEFSALRDTEHRHDVYRMVLLGFRDPLTSGLYIVAMVLLGLHLSHGVPSAFQSLGLSNQAWAPTIRKLGLGVTLFVVIGNISIPLTILLGLFGHDVSTAGH
jgi:succinate dehydrogenase / fumarate reductase cytochrome b subunit